jgi:signal transduction histidine kinase
VNQILAGTKMYLSSAGKKAEQVKELIQYPVQLIDQAIEEIRSLCYDLVTPQKIIKLNDLIQDSLHRLAETSAIPASLTYTIPDDLIPDDLKLNIYRIVQELLNNAAKYSEAKKIQIIVISKAGFISVTVADDGKGFNTKQKRKGIGFSNIIYRAECFNGKVSIKSSPGKGCKVHVKIPY